MAVFRLREWVLLVECEMKVKHDKRAKKINDNGRNCDE